LKYFHSPPEKADRDIFGNVRFYNARNVLSKHPNPVASKV
jgi:hypothetical protein